MKLHFEFLTRQKGIHGPIHDLIENEIRKAWPSDFGKGAFGKYLGIIRRLHVSDIRAASIARHLFKETLEAEADNPPALFLWKLKKYQSKKVKNMEEETQQEVSEDSEEQEAPEAEEANENGSDSDETAEEGESEDEE